MAVLLIDRYRKPPEGSVGCAPLTRLMLTGGLLLACEFSMAGRGLDTTASPPLTSAGRGSGLGYVTPISSVWRSSPNPTFASDFVHACGSRRLRCRTRFRSGSRFRDREVHRGFGRHLGGRMDVRRDSA